MDKRAHEASISTDVSFTLLPFRHEDKGLLFEVSAPDVLATFTWRGVQALAASSLSTLSARTGKNASFWFEPAEGVNPAGRPDLVLQLWFALERGFPTELDGAALRRGLRPCESPLSFEGVVRLSERAHPSLVLAGKEMHQVWLLDPPDVVAPFLSWNDRTDELEILGARQTCLEDADLMACSRHSLLICPDDSVLRT